MEDCLTTMPSKQPAATELSYTAEASHVLTIYLFVPDLRSFRVRYCYLVKHRHHHQDIQYPYTAYTMQVPKILGLVAMLAAHAMAAPVLSQGVMSKTPSTMCHR